MFLRRAPPQVLAMQQKELHELSAMQSVVCDGRSIQHGLKCGRIVLVIQQPVSVPWPQAHGIRIGLSVDVLCPQALIDEGVPSWLTSAWTLCTSERGGQTRARRGDVDTLLRPAAYGAGWSSVFVQVRAARLALLRAAQPQVGVTDWKVNADSVDENQLINLRHQRGERDLG